MVGTASNEWTSTDYDTLGRPVKVTYPDATFAVTSYLGAATTVYDAQTTGQAVVNARRLEKDGLGRLTQVVESPSSGPVTTAYLYDGLDNLTKVTQGVGTATPQVRDFWYDSSKRLRRAANPETGDVYFTYDDNGNVTSKRHGSLVVNYSYDALNRLTDKSYAGVTTEAVKQCWDGTRYSLGSCQGAAVTGLRDRLTSVGVASSVTDYEFDLTGRVTRVGQRTVGAPVSEIVTRYSYYRDGSRQSQTYPSSRVVTQCYDDLGRTVWLSQAVGATCGGTAPDAYASSIAYWPHGAVKQMRLGNGLWEGSEIDSKMRPRAMKLGTAVDGSQEWRLENEYSASGNVMKQTLGVPSRSGIITSYGYDAFNRLEVAVEGPANAASPVCPDAGAQWCEKYGYDIFGNRLIAARVGVSAEIGREPQGYDGNNRISTSGFVYGDGRGNLTGNAAGEGFAYDGENRLVAVSGASAMTAVYDGEGRRVKKDSAAGTVYYGYGADGKVVVEYAAGTASAGTQYLTTDHLGSTRVLSGVGAVKVEGRYDYLPFGGALGVSAGNPRSGVAGYEPPGVVRVKFTGKERDQETGLDYFGARYMSGGMGVYEILCK